MSVMMNLSRLMKLGEGTSDAMKYWAPIPLRLIVGYGFMAHGYAKLMKGPDVFVGIVHALGVPAPHLMAWPSRIVRRLLSWRSRNELHCPSGRRCRWKPVL